MARRLPVELVEAVDEADLERRLRELVRGFFWPFKTDRAHAGGSSPSSIDDSPHSKGRERLYVALCAERRRLERLGRPAAGVLAGVESWLVERGEGERVQRIADTYRGPRAV